MNDPFENDFAGFQEPLEAQAAPAPRGRPVLAWGVILLIVVGLTVLRESAPDRAAAAGDNRLDDFLVKVQYRLLVGLGEAARQEGLEQLQQALPPPRGSVEQRLNHVVVAGELSGPQEALDQLNVLEQDLIKYKQETTKEQNRLRGILKRLYQDYVAGRVGAPSLNREDRAFLRERMGWFGELALAPPGLPLPNPAAAVGGGLAVAAITSRDDVLEPAQHAFSVFFGAIGLMMFLGLIGLVGLIVLLALAAGGSLRSRIDCPTGRGGIYAETFALWLLVWLGLNLAAFALARGGPDLLLASAATVLSLVVLAWPVQRGIPWRQVRRDIGLTWGQNPGTEPVAGIASYVMALPLLAVGLVTTLVLLFLQRDSAAENANPFVSPGTPSHPVVEPLVFGDWGTRIVILLLAVVVAPLVEEIMFRGVLYRHLREATCRWAPLLSIVVSGTVTSLIFAIVHPQGLFAVPVLMALAYGFTIAREWRGTLIPCMVAHGLSNGIMLTLLLLVAWE